MPEEKFFADSATEVGLNPDKVQALMNRAERDVKEGILPACQVAIARKGRIAAMKNFRSRSAGRVPFTEIYRKHFDIAALAEDLG